MRAKGLLLCLSLLAWFGRAYNIYDSKLFALQAKDSPLEAFTHWRVSLNKAYAQDEELEHRFRVWLDNLEYVLEYNAKHTSHWLGMGVWADLTQDEYRSRALGYRADLAAQRPPRLGSSLPRADDPSIPESIDWREKNVVTPVKNQKMCGSCWSFATTGAIEGISAIKTGELHVLSEQQLVDCDRERDNGCHGGLMDYAYDYVVRNGGLNTETDYPYRAQEATCDRVRESRRVVTIDGYEDVPRLDEGALRAAVSRQPVAVAIEADQRAFQLYAGGVFDAPCGVALDHGVLVVGYGSENNGTADLPYWTIKNSWGAAWGDKGYIRISRSAPGAVPGNPGQCGIAMQPSYPVKKTDANPPATPPTPPSPPPSPGPEPVVCDATTACPPGSTCCCMREFFNYCFAWACCPLNGAVCCDDHQHCCPSNLPVCDPTAARCLKAPGFYLGSEPMIEKLPAQRHLPDWRDVARAFFPDRRRDGVADA